MLLDGTVSGLSYTIDDVVNFDEAGCQIDVKIAPNVVVFFRAYHRSVFTDKTGL